MTRSFVVLLASPMACVGEDTVGDSGEPSVPVESADTASEPVDSGDPETADTGMPGPAPIVVRGILSAGEGVSIPAVGAVFSVADRDGTFLFSAVADSSGEATLGDVPAGASVTFVPAPEITTNRGQTWTEQQITTVFGVEPGDVLQFGRATTAFVAARGTVSLTVAANPSPQATGLASVWARCGGQLTLTNLPDAGDLFLLGDCRPGPEDLLVVNLESLQGGRALGYLPATVQLDADRNGSIDLAGWPTEYGVVRIVPDPGLDDGSLQARLQGHFGSGIITAADVRTPTPVDAIVTPAFDAVLLESTYRFTQRTEPVTSVPVAGQTVELALGPGDFLPPIDDLVFDAIQRPSVSSANFDSSVTCSGTPLDAVSGIVWTSRATSTTRFDGTWRFLGPVAETLTLPEVDPSLADVWPSADTGSNDLSINTFALIDGDYRDLRQRPVAGIGSLVPAVPSGPVCSNAIGAVQAF